MTGAEGPGGVSTGGAGGGPAADEDWVGAILQRDARYQREAFEFVNEALRLAHVRSGREGHVTARELLDAFRDLARDQFGPLARTVAESWNVRSTEDIGNIVFLCVSAGGMGKTDEDSIQDFRGVYHFADVFPPDPGAVAIPRRPGPDDEPDGPDAVPE